MDVTVTSNALDGLLATVRKQVNDAWRTAGEVGKESAEFGSKTARSYTSTRPGATTGKAGRVDTGSMLSDLRWKPVSFSADLIHTQYGFTDRMRDYYRFQTITGFTHVRSVDAKYIAPTFALRDSRGPVTEFARNQLRGRL